MPTARELLDQADALMRRNRSLVRDDIPVLTEAVPPETAAQMTQSSLLAEGPAEPRERFDAPPTAFDELDDVPVLTDAVEEIEVPSVLDPIEPGGEPSAWLDFDDDGARSVIDAAADSIVVVPDIETPEPERDQTDVERFDRELQPAGRDGGAYAEPQPAQLEHAPGGAAEIVAQPEEAVFVEETAEPDEAVIVEEPTALQDDSVAEEFAPRSDESAVVEKSAPQPDAAVEEATAFYDEPIEEPGVLQDEAGVAEVTAAQADQPAVTEEFAPQLDESVVLEEPAAQPDESDIVEAIDLPAQPAIEESAAPAPAHDDARWTEMAEEIRMQVLQRIDLFTDIGLREQLGVHLRPIVDRASAELVATINREVGELLRAYIAETIEREIERWRQEN